MAHLAERHKYILDSMAQNGLIKVSELAEKLGVTPTTIRKDLNALESKGLLYRAYGGALPTTKQIMDISLTTKKLINFEVKERIAAAADQLIQDNDSIIMASGSTLAIFAEHLTPKGRLNVVSTSVNISAILGEMPGVTVMQVGGLLYSNTLSVLGLDAINSIRNVYCSKSFIGVDGFDPAYGITCAAVEEAELCQQIIRSSERAIVLSDSSKCGRKGFVRICGMDSISTLITDDRLPDEARKAIEEQGVEVITV